MIDGHQVRHVARLARIDLSDEEIDRFGPQLSSVMDYMAILDEVDTDGTEPTSQVTGLENVMEKDEILPSQSSGEELLDCSELHVEDNQLRVSRII